MYQAFELGDYWSLLVQRYSFSIAWWTGYTGERGWFGHDVKSASLCIVGELQVTSDVQEIR